MTRVALALAAGLVAALLPGLPAPTAAAAECTWPMTTLPVPEGYTRAYLGAAAEGGWFVGSVSGGGKGDQNVRWKDNQVEVLNGGFDDQTELWDVNASGVAVGRTYANGDLANAVIYRNGAYERLPKLPGVNRVGATAINAAGDIVGRASTGIDDVQALLWPAARPGTVEIINPDPALYWDTSPVDIDDQGRILMIGYQGGSYGDAVLRHPDGTYAEVPVPTANGKFAIDSFTGGRLAGTSVNPAPVGQLVGVWDLQGNLVQQLPKRTSNLVADATGTAAGILRNEAGTYDFALWENGVRTQVLATRPDSGELYPAATTNDGVVAVTTTSLGTLEQGIAVFRRTC